MMCGLEVLGKSHQLDPALSVIFHQPPIMAFVVLDKRKCHIPIWVRALSNQIIPIVNMMKTD
jgi:hypothetical protein